MDDRYLDSNTFTDIAGLDRLREGAQKNDAEALKKVAQQFESIFVNMWLKSMREANEAFESDSPFNSRHAKFFQQMADQQMATDLSSKGTLGLAELIVQQLSPESSNMTPASVLRDSNAQLAGPSLAPEPAAMSLPDSAPSLELKRPVATTFTNEDLSLRSLSAALAKPAKAGDHLDQARVDAAEQTKTASQNVKFSSPQDFVAQLLPHAERAAKAIKADPALLLAQAALETGWGEKIIRQADGSSSHNLFNIKADQRWDGAKTSVTTLEYEQQIPVKRSALFRAYDSVSDSFDDLVSFLKSSPRYQQALSVSDKPADFLHSLQQAGYATDPRYADKILGVLDKVNELVK